MRVRQETPWLVLATGCVAAAALPAVAQVSLSAALLFAPFVFLLLALVFGRYPGEQAITRLRERFARRGVRARHKLCVPRPLERWRPIPQSALARKRGLRAPPHAVAAV